MSDIRGWVAQDTVYAADEGTRIGVKTSKMGHLVLIDWFTQMALEGRAYHVRAGTLSVPLVGDAPLADQSAEMCADCTLGTTIVPAYVNVSVNLGTGTLHEYAAKSIGSVSTAGTAFVPLPVMIGGAVATTTARVDAAGAVSVGAEAATTTRRHWAVSNPVAVAAGHGITTHEWNPVEAPTLVGPSCFYVQIAATTTGPSYFASFDYIELTTASVS